MHLRFRTHWFAFAILFGSCTGIFAQSPTSTPALESLLRPAVDPDGDVEFRRLLSLGFTPLFDGQSLDGWRNPYDHGTAKIVDGEIHLTADKKFFLVTEKAYSDFCLCVQIHLPSGKANSGVMFRCHVDPTAPRKRVFGYQAECDGSDRRWSGGLYDEGRRGWIWPSTKGRSRPEFISHEDESKAAFAEPMVRNALVRDGWNQYVVTCIQDRIKIKVNGVETVNIRDTLDASGYLGIQHHGETGQTYRFRNLFIKELPEIPAEDCVTLFDQAAVAITKPKPDVTLVDFGKVAFGNIAIRIRQEGRGNATLHFGEKLLNGRIDRNPPGTVRYGTASVRRGSGERGSWVVPAPVDLRNTEQMGTTGSHPPAVLTPDSWLPVMPFRWVEIEGWPTELKPDQITRRAAFATEWNDDAAHFECSEDLLNRIWELCKYSIRATTFAGVYVDGDRERIPYEADAYLNQLSHYYTDDDVRMARRTFDWLMANGTWPTEWAPHMVFMAHAEWMHSGDTQWLADRYESLKTKTLLNRVDASGLVQSGPMDVKRHDIVDWPKGERDGYVFRPYNTVVNAFHLEALARMIQMARAVGKDAEADAFAAQRQKCLAEFQRVFFRESEGLYRDGIGTDHSSAHANFFPLAFGLVPEDRRPGIANWLSKRGMVCSVYAAQYLMESLFENGNEDEAFALMTADGDRSWKHMVESGTTITWEAWDMKYKPNQDWNHAWGAAPANLLPRYVLGVQPTAAGWKTASIRPMTGSLTSAKGSVPTAKGTIEIQWTKPESDAGGVVFQLSAELPDGILASVDVPEADDSATVWVNGRQVAAKRDGPRLKLDQTVRGKVNIEVRKQQSVTAR